MTIKNLYEKIDIGENSEIEFKNAKDGLDKKVKDYFRGTKS